MNGLWVYLTIFLDVYPWLFLQYLPFRSALRFGYGKALLFCSLALLLWQLGFVWISAQRFFTPDVMLAYRVFQLVLLQILTWVFIRSPFAKTAFVFCLLFPFSMLILVFASYVAPFWPAAALPVYRLTSLLRLGLSVLLFPFLLWLWKRILIPVMDVQEEAVWRYAWPIPAAFSLVSLFYTRNDFETAGVPLGEVLGRSAIFLGTLLSCLLLFKMLEQARERIRVTEEAEKGRFLLETQAEQYRALSESIEKTRRFRHDIRQHMAVILDLANRGELDGLKNYASRLQQSSATDRPLTLCDNRAANAIASYYLARAEEGGVSIGIQAAIPENIGVENIDLTIVLGNLLENALEACAAIPEKVRQIDLRARMQGSRLFLVLSNACGEAARETPSGFLSRKRGYESVGAGLKSVRAVCEKYGGETKIVQKPGRFSVSVMLQRKESGS